MKSALRLLLGGVCIAAVMPLGAQTLDLALDAVEHPAFAARQIALRLTKAGAAELEIGRLTVGMRQFGHVRLRCGEFDYSAERISCRRGELRPAQAAPLPLEFSYRPKQKLLEVDLRHGALASLAVLVPELAAYHPGGQFNARLKLAATRVDAHVSLRGAAFGTAEGTQAGDRIEAGLDVSLLRQADGWRWQAALDWPHGELYVAPLYRSGAMGLAASGTVAPGLLAVERATLKLDGIGTASGSLRWQPAAGQQPGRLLAAEVASGPLDLTTLVPQFVQPFIDARAGAKLTAQGTARLSVALGADGINRADVELTDAGVAAGSNALHGVQARIPWRRDAATQAQFHAAGGKFGALPLGAFELPLALHGYEFDLPRAEIPLLDGKLLFEDFHAARVKDAWQWRLAGALEPLSMPLLTQALGWPQMDGVLSASIPQISYRDATLALDGQLVVSVFDGYLSASRLRLIEPFGRLPRLQADIMARHIDLGMLTRTFSFGDISGYVDADVEGLEMHGLQPLAFAAQVRSSAGGYPKRISQRALQNISALGGAGAAAAIQRSVLRVFETFGYQQIGLRCWLKNGVCQMGGIEAGAEDYVPLAERLRLPGSRASLASDNAYQLVQGGGLPALNVIGYNRRVDWRELTTRLQAVIAGNGRMEMR